MNQFILGVGKNVSIIYVLIIPYVFQTINNQIYKILHSISSKYNYNEFLPLIDIKNICKEFEEQTSKESELFLC